MTTYDLYRVLLVITMLVWSAFYIARRRLEWKAWSGTVELFSALIIVAASFGRRFLFPVEFAAEPNQDYDLLYGITSGIGWLTILEYLSYPSLHKLYCRTCWWKITDKNRCLNAADLGGNEGSIGTWIDDGRVRACLKCGGHRSRVKDFDFLKGGN